MKRSSRLSQRQTGSRTIQKPDTEFIFESTFINVWIRVNSSIAKLFSGHDYWTAVMRCYATAYREDAGSAC
ncbi:hypothetical protein OKW28_000207 [Paraburkholderia sp. 40]